MPWVLLDNEQDEPPEVQRFLLKNHALHQIYKSGSVGFDDGHLFLVQDGVRDSTTAHLKC